MDATHDIIPGGSDGNALLESALAYAARGWPVFPVHDVAGGKCSCGRNTCAPRSWGKHPRTPHGCKDGTTDPESIRRWWTQWPSANVGVVTGAASGIVMLGPDGDEGIRDLAGLEERHGFLESTPTAKSGSGGRHLIFSHPGGTINNRKNHLGTKIDVRGDGGYFVAAPSVNASGRYEWIDPPDQVEVAAMPQWLIDWMRDDGKAKSAPASPSLQPTFDAALAGQRVERARAYLANVRPAVAGEGGHDATLWAARVLVRGFALDRGTARGLMHEYSARCSPPWSDKEIEHKLDDAETKPFDKPAGWLLDAPRPERNGTHTALSASLPAGTEPERPRFEFIDSKQFASGDYRPTWLIKGVLTRGEPGGIGGPMKSLKTSIAVDMALSVATGTPFVGHFDVPCPVTTAIISGESGRSTLQKIAERVCDAKGITLESVGDRLHWCTDIPRLDDHAGMTIFADELAKRGVGFVLLDPLFLMLGDVNAANLFEAGALLRNVGTLLIKAGVTPVFLHHARKVMEPGKPMELADLSHSGFAEFVRQFVLLNRMNPYRAGETQELIARIGGSAGHGGEFLLSIDEGVLDEDFNGRIWSVRVTNTADMPKATQEDRDAKRTEANKAKGAAKREKFLNDIDTELAAGFPAITQSKLKDKYGWQYADVKTISESLLIDGEIELHEFPYKAGKNATKIATGFRRPVPVTQSEIEFPINRLENDQPVFSDVQPVKPVDPREGVDDQPDQPVGLSPDKGESTGQPVDLHHVDENRKTEPRTQKTTGRRYGAVNAPGMAKGGAA